MHQTRPLPDIHPELTVIHWQGFTEYRVANWRLARDGSGHVVRATSVFSWIDVCVLVLVAICVVRPLCSRTRSRPSNSVIDAGTRTHRAHSSPCSLRCDHNHMALGQIDPSSVRYVLPLAQCVSSHDLGAESLLVFPTLGIQLETHRGHPLIPRSLFTTRRFVPLSALQDVVIHEGLRGWNVRFYLALLQRRRASRALSGLSATSGVSSASGTLGEPGASGALSRSGAGNIEVHVAFEVRLSSQLLLHTNISMSQNILPYFPVLKEVYLDVQQTLFPPPTRIVEDDSSVQDGGRSGDQGR